MKFFEFIQKALSEDNTNPSSARLNVFIAVIALVPCVAFTLVYVVLTNKDLITATLDAVLAFLVTLYGLKVWQKGKEEKPDDKPEDKPAA